ncbi:hypothetical protein [Roseomonas indoligenes]|uniref:Uncharacterized protein n=1 Tax=Roseomonas indoligenes TaxID=2820811 RepID=A0A940S6T8_9PROT|nr:hypothetical protein [Pararoseomonas indoligenes]MBP0494260.1 hypothetical protein [Pararoseomonas indoligenes]
MTTRRLLLAAALSGARPAAAQRDSRASFAAYWHDFRAAVLAGDMGAVTRMSRLPLESRGELDDEPVRRLTAATLPSAFRRLLRTVEDVRTNRTVLEVIRDTPEPTLDPRNSAPDQARVSSLAFARGRDGWRLVTIYRGPEE